MLKFIYKMRQSITVVFLLLLIILSGCSKKDDLSNPQYKPTVIIETNKLIYAENDTVFFEFYVINTYNSPIELFASNQPVQDVVVWEGDGSTIKPPIWQWHPDSTLESWYYELAPGETLNLGENLLFWLQLNSNGNLVSRGAYYANGILETEPYYLSEEVYFNLE